jgi:hypothetical protein
MGNAGAKGNRLQLFEVLLFATFAPPCGRVATVSHRCDLRDYRRSAYADVLESVACRDPTSRSGIALSGPVRPRIPGTGTLKLRAEDIAACREVLGYLNFSGGRPDPAFQRLVNDLTARVTFPRLSATLLKVLSQLQAEVPAFHDSTQAETVVKLAFERVIPAYREFHRDLLFHLTDEDFEQPFFLARVWEAILQQSSLWDDTDRVVAGALDWLNDFLGYRPIAVLENGQRMQPYEHERFRPIPLFLRGAGVAHGPYAEVVTRALELLRSTPTDILTEAHFSLDALNELALDPRAHDHLHPANKRTNYLFGEWDPHQIDLKGRYRRFVVRKVILDALLNWIKLQKRVPTEEVLFDAAAVLSGTILMASAISGAGPDTHDSTVSLTSLLPRVARQRDAYYARLLEAATGTRAKRLQKHAKTTQQPFGHVRQHLNFYLAQYGTQQVQRRYLAYLFARMAQPDAARQQANSIPCAAARFECEIQWRLAAIRQALTAGDVVGATQMVTEAEDQLHRGIHCGALADPWNILGFQGQFPLFTTREDSVPDQRIEVLIQLVEGILEGYGRALEEAAARDQSALEAELQVKFEKFAEFWDKFGATTVHDLPPVLGQDHLESSRRVARALADWRAAGEAAGNIAFWREHVGEFQSAKAYAQVVSALLDRHDQVASLGLLMQWLSEADEVGLQAGPMSFDRLLTRWVESVAESASSNSAAGEPATDPWPLVRRLFDYLEANAGDFWHVPQLEDAVAGAGVASDWSDNDSDEDDAEGGLFGAAYEGVVFRDSADDGNFGEVADQGGSLPDAGEFEVFEDTLEPRLGFLRMLAQLWHAAAGLCVQSNTADADFAAKLSAWHERTVTVQKELGQLLESLYKREISAPSGDHDANVEYDAQLQTKLYLLQVTVNTIVAFRSAEWSLLAALPAPPAKGTLSALDDTIITVLRALHRGDGDEVRKQLPALQRALRKQPLLYVPLDHGGHPQQVLAARTIQALIRRLLRYLPQLGLLRETWHMLRTAHQMERASRPQGLAVTEFDRLFRIALKSTLEAVVQASTRWRSGRYPDEDLIELVGSVVELYLDQWLGHSSTMRLSTVEALKLDGLWDETRKFIERYGGELFHARQLTLGNVRAILHQGVENYLNFLAENEDPLHPSRLLADVESNRLDQDDVVEHLALIYQIVVERYDRFLEYNSTTTQSDYGEVFYSLLDFLRLETAYDRDAWNLLPVALAHEVLARSGKEDAAQIWEDVFTAKTEDMAARHLAELARLERQYGMRLPSVTNHLEEQFVKPLTVNKMVALIGPTCTEAQWPPAPPPPPKPARSRSKAAAATPMPSAFRRLQFLVEEYLKTTSGSGLEVPPWLRLLEDELNRVQNEDDRWQAPDFEPELRLPQGTLSLREFKQQLRQWRDPLSSRKRKS